MPVSSFDVGECCCGVGCLPCSPCQIPRKDLVFSWVNPFRGDGSATLVYDGSGAVPTWTGSFFYNGAPWTVVLKCTPGGTQLCFGFTAFGTTTTCCGTSSIHVVVGDAMNLVAYTCNPYHLEWYPAEHFTTDDACFNVWLTGFTHVYVDDPGPLTPCP